MNTRLRNNKSKQLCATGKISSATDCGIEPYYLSSISGAETQPGGPTGPRCASALVNNFTIFVISSTGHLDSSP